MSAASRPVASVPAPARSTTPKLVEAPKPPAAGFRPSTELRARIDTLCALSGESLATFYERAVTREVETREAATAFRRTLDTLPDPAWRARPADAAPLRIATLVAPSDGAPSLPFIPNLVEAGE